MSRAKALWTLETRWAFCSVSHAGPLVRHGRCSPVRSPQARRRPATSRTPPGPAARGPARQSPPGPGARAPESSLHLEYNPGLPPSPGPALRPTKLQSQPRNLPRNFTSAQALSASEKFKSRALLAPPPTPLRAGFSAQAQWPSLRARMPGCNRKE